MTTQQTPTPPTETVWPSERTLGQPQRWLIVGCGYLGQRLAAGLAARGAKVYATTRLPQNAETFAARGWQPVRYDATAPDAGDPLPQVDCLVWAVGWDRRSGRSMREVYVEGLAATLEKLTRGQPPPRRLVYVGSTSVYGQGDGSWVDETSPAEPVSESGRISREAEGVVEATTRQLACEGVGAIVARHSGLYGPDRWPGLSTLRAGGIVGGSPQRWLNLVHVEDAARAVMTLGTMAGPRPGETQVVLVSDDNPIQRGEYYGLLAQCAETKPPQFDTTAGDDHGNRRIANQRLRQTYAVTLQYPDVRLAMAATWPQTWPAK